jgi:photosystem II stability/assembly factor-like uncharacterized protein
MENYYKQCPSFRLIIPASLLFLFCFVAPGSAGELSVIAPLATSSLLLDAQRVEEALIVVGERGHLLISEDGGGSWRQIQVPTRATLTSVYFVDRLHGWVVGHDQVILRTQDGGKHWEFVYENSEAESPLLAVYFRNVQHGFAVGAYGRFLETFDGGGSWKGRFISEDDFHLNQILALGDKLFIAAEAGLAYRSDDNGESWVALTPDYSGSFFGLLPLGGDKLLLFGLRGNLFRSEDAGDSWTRIDTATEASLTAGLRLSDGHLVIAGLAGTLLISHDNGQSFALLQDLERRGFSRLLQTADGEIVAVGDFGVTKLSLTGLHTEK